MFSKPAKCYIPIKPSKLLFPFDFEKRCIPQEIGLCCDLKFTTFTLRCGALGRLSVVLWVTYRIFFLLTVYFRGERLGGVWCCMYRKPTSAVGECFDLSPCFLCRLMFWVLPDQVSWRPHCNLAWRWCGLGQHLRFVSAIRFECYTVRVESTQKAAAANSKIWVLVLVGQVLLGQHKSNWTGICLI